MSRKISYFGFLFVVAAVLAIGLTSAAQATVIVSDTFTRADGNLDGWTPDVVNLPGGTYGMTGQPSSWGYPQILSNQVRLSTDQGESVSIASAGSYTKPTQFTISALVNVGTIATYSVPPRGVGLGFYADLGALTGGGNRNFVGVFVHPTTGDLVLDKDPSLTDGAITETVAHSGAWNPAAWHALSYDVNTTTGSISNVLLDGVGYTFSATTVFTNAQTARAGFDVSSGAGNTYGYVDNFVVSTIPEPSTLALLVAGLVGLLCYAWRKRK